MVQKAKIAAVSTFGASILSLLYSLLLLKSIKAALVVYILGLAIVAVFLEPFIGLINYMIFLYLRPQEFVTGVVGFPLILLIGTVTFLIMFLHFAVRKKRIMFSEAPQNIFMLWFLCAIIISHLSHLYMHAAVSSAREFLSTLVMYLLISNLVSDLKKLKITMYLLCLLTLVLAGQGIYQHFTGTGLAGQTMIQGRIRGIGIFSDPNDLALTFLIMLPFLFFTLSSKSSTLARVFSVVSLMILLYALYLTNSRGGILSLGFLAFLIFTRRYGLVPGLSAGVLIFIAIFVFGPARISDLSPAEDSAYGRIDAWGAGMQMLKQNPIFGVGAGSFMDHHFRTAHNSILLCASELGMFGLFAWVIMIFISMKNLLFISREARTIKGGSIAILSDSIFFSFVAFLAAAFFLSRTYNELLYILIALSVSATNIFLSNTMERYRLIEKSDFLYAFLIIGLFLLVMKLILVLYW